MAESADPADPAPQRQREELPRALLREDAFPHPVTGLEVIETHISWVILTGTWAYKIKKPVRLPFVDFSTLADRAAACGDELRLNRRWGDAIYRDLCPVIESPAGLRIGPALEDDRAADPQSDPRADVRDWAVRMVQFDQDRLLTACVRSGELGPSHLEDFALALARFHRRVDDPTSAPASERRHALPEAIAEAVLDNFRDLGEADLDGDDLARRDRLRRWSVARLSDCAAIMASRRDAGLVREGHGDLHLGNMLLLDGRVELFDCLEFSAELRWGDVMCEVAFLVMDLEEHGRRDLAGRFLNAYLEHTGDHGGLVLLPLFITYRAMVRAKVAQFERAGPARDSRERDRSLLARARGYLRLAESWTRHRAPRLAIMSGLSGSGKTYQSRRFVDRGFIRLRSDFERKRLAGLAADVPLARDAGPESERPSPVITPDRLYGQEATRLTYEVLCRRAERCLDAGWSVVVDATCLKASQRRLFFRLADRLEVPCRLFVLEHTVSELERRIRSRGDSDLSDADVSVLHGQLRSREPLDQGERPRATVIDGRQDDPESVIERWLDGAEKS